MSDMKKYTIITFIFGNYDIIREPEKIDTDADYIMVTDKPIQSKFWRVCVDKTLVNKNPIYASYYVRWHPYRYASTDTVFVVDASIQINSSLADIYKAFHDSPAVYAPICTNYPTDEEKLDQWENDRKDITKQDADKLRGLIKKFNREEQKGSIGQAFIGYKKCDIVCRFQRHVWKYLIALGQYGVPNRLDEIVVHKLLERYLDKMAIFPTSVQIIQSSYMTYCSHKSSIPNKIRANYDQFYYICGKPVSPYRFDLNNNFPMSYRYKTEAILLTKYLNHDDLIEWLDHHLTVVKFDHIHVFDNESDYDVKSVCDLYGSRVSYQKIYGHPRQYKLYDAYINTMSAAEWVMPIDDDEYLDIGDFGSIYEAIEYYRNKLPHLMILGVRWKHMFPKKFHTERTSKVLDYCTEPNPELAKSFILLGDTTIKCLVRRYGNVHYEETWENPAGGHVPKHTCFFGAAMCDGRGVTGCGIPDCPDVLDDERIRLLHCRYKGYSDWMNKYGNADNEKNCRTVCDSSVRDKRFVFNKLLETLE